MSTTLGTYPLICPIWRGRTRSPNICGALLSPKPAILVFSKYKRIEQRSDTGRFSTGYWCDASLMTPLVLTYSERVRRAKPTCWLQRVSLRVSGLLKPELHMKIRCRPNGHNRTGPPWTVGCPTADSPGASTAHAPGGRPDRPPAALQTPTDDDRRQRPLIVCPYTMCRRASNNNVYLHRIRTWSYTTVVVREVVNTVFLWDFCDVLSN